MMDGAGFKIFSFWDELRTEAGPEIDRETTYMTVFIYNAFGELTTLNHPLGRRCSGATMPSEGSEDQQRPEYRYSFNNPVS